MVDILFDAPLTLGNDTACSPFFLPKVAVKMEIREIPPDVREM
jgi:hypothetical protein